MKTTAAAVLINMIIAEATALREEEKKANGKNGGKTDARQAAIQAVFNSTTRDGGPFGCHTPAVATLVSAITGLDIKANSATHRDYPKQFSVVVPNEANKDSHSHPTGKPAMAMSTGGYALDIDGVQAGYGASYDVLRKDWVRPATDEEFNAYIEVLKANVDKAYGWLQKSLGMNYIFPKE